MFAPAVAHAAQPTPQTLSGPELSAREKVIHVLNRLAYGPRPGEVDRIAAEEGADGWIKKQMEPEKIDDSALEKDVHARFKWAEQKNILDVRKYAPEEGKGDQSRHNLKDELPKLVILRAAESNRQFKEVMCDFWRNHFCVDSSEFDRNKTRRWTAAHYEDQVIRTHVFGKFKDMLFASARHPAMLEYLDNQYSKAGNWNENYARELMELHTLGADRGYGNEDVKELSKILTGWRYNKDFAFEFDKSWHQPGVKHWIGYNIPEGYEAGEQAVNYLATHKYTAEFISMKLVRYLVNDNPPPALVKKVANVFRETDGDLPKVYTAILTSPEFFSRENYHSKFKTPFQFCVSAIRATNAKIEDAGETEKYLQKMGEPIYLCPDPTGYFDQAERWMDAGVLTTRWDYGQRLARDGVGGVSISKAFMEKYASIGDHDKMVAKVIDDILAGEVGDKEKHIEGNAERVIGILLGGPSFQQR
jgi:uncharacterized protein (DUF1800 family)